MGSFAHATDVAVHYNGETQLSITNMSPRESTVIFRHEMLAGFYFNGEDSVISAFSSSPYEKIDL